VQSGGSVSAINAHFVNNTIGALFQTNAQGGSFTFTNFDLNNNYLRNKTSFEAHLKMQASGKVFVTGCHFLSAAQNSATHMNNGIKANNTCLDIREYCDPSGVLNPQGFCDEQFQTRTTFSGFSYAIASSNTGGMPPLYVRFTDFYNNL